MGNNNYSSVIDNTKIGELVSAILDKIEGIEEIRIPGKRAEILERIQREFVAVPLRNSSGTSQLELIKLSYLTPASNYTERKETSVIIKSSTNNGYEPKKTQDMHDFLQGINIVPELKRSGIKGTSFIKFVSHTTLEEKLEMHNSKSERIEIVNHVIDTIAKLQAIATIRHFNRLTQKPQRKPAWLFLQESIETKFLGYIAGIMGLESIEEINPELKRKIAALYQPIKTRHENTENNVICHGDICTTNILCEKDKEGNYAYYLIDPRLILGSLETDLAALLSCPGMNSCRGYDENLRFTSEEWKEFAEKHFLQFYKMDLEGKGIKTRKRYLPFLRKRDSMELEEETQRRLNGNLFLLIAHYSLRNLAVNRSVRRKNPERYREWIEKRPSFRYAEESQEMQYNIYTTYTLLSKRPSDYNLTEEEGEQIRELRDTLLNERIIEPLHVEGLKEK